MLIPYHFVHQLWKFDCSIIQFVEIKGSYLILLYVVTFTLSFVNQGGFQQMSLYSPTQTAHHGQTTMIWPFNPSSCQPSCRHLPVPRFFLMPRVYVRRTLSVCMIHLLPGMWLLELIQNWRVLVCRRKPYHCVSVWWMSVFSCVVNATNPPGLNWV